jgi:tetratricopeptide (TPR) repeat protein
MTKCIITVVFFVTSLVGAQTQYEQGMQKAFALWGEGKTTEASAMFERIASAEKNNWLPNYYVSMVNTTAAFQTKDKDKVAALLGKAQEALNIELDKNPENPELLVLQAMINTAWIVSDPMTNGMKLSAKTIEIYNKALVIAPENPRALFSKAEFEIGGARYFGNDTKPMCAEIDKAIELFAKFKPETPFHPSWGLDRALEAQKECNKKK